MNHSMARRAFFAMALGSMLALCAEPSLAGQARSDFNVTVTLGEGNAEGSGTDFCRVSHPPGAFGADVTVVCSTGVVVEVSPDATGRRYWRPTHGGAYQYLLPYPGTGVIGGTDLYTGLGTVTSWRVVQMADREYLELMVRW
jgi:hypothetical protein